MKSDLEICLECPYYDETKELIYGVDSGNCDIDDYLECDKI